MAPMVQARTGVFLFAWFDNPATTCPTNNPNLTIQK
jgi:hypothetical protein